jgi:hypothetical protein
MSDEPVQQELVEESLAPGRMESFLMRMGTAGELLSMFVRGGRWWMLPLLLIFLLLGLILVLLQSVQYVAPFIYMVF